MQSHWVRLSIEILPRIKGQHYTIQLAHRTVRSHFVTCIRQGVCSGDFVGGSQIVIDILCAVQTIVVNELFH